VTDFPRSAPGSVTSCSTAGSHLQRSETERKEGKKKKGGGRGEERRRRCKNVPPLPPLSPLHRFLMTPPEKGGGKKEEGKEEPEGLEKGFLSSKYLSGG